MNRILSKIVVIPARYGSTRFPGKPLAQINGKPLIYWVVKRAEELRGIDKIIVATDHLKIFQAVTELTDAQPVMTPSDLASGSDRVAWVAGKLTADIVVNLQGDEPLFDVAAVQEGLNYLENNPRQNVVTLAAPLYNPEEWQNPNVVKVILNELGQAIYFSRSPIPYFRDSAFAPLPVLRKHVGIYIYRKEFLLKYSQMPPSPLENAEKLEQLRILEAGYSLYVVRSEFESVGVDCPEDLEKVKNILKE